MRSALAARYMLLDHHRSGRNRPELPELQSEFPKSSLFCPKSRMHPLTKIRAMSRLIARILVPHSVDFTLPDFIDKLIYLFKLIRLVPCLYSPVGHNSEFVSSNSSLDCIVPEGMRIMGYR